MGKEKVNCPICGRFVSKGLEEKYEELKKERDILRITNESLKKQNSLLSERNSHIEDSLERILQLCDGMKEDLDAMRSRGFWSRLFNI